jgi:hypothetical protein
MALKKFMEKSGNPVWINEDQVAAVGTIYSDGTERGEAEGAEPMTYVLLSSGVTLHLDHGAEAVANRIQPA